MGSVADTAAAALNDLVTSMGVEQRNLSLRATGDAAGGNNKARWTNKEHELFLHCLKTFGKDWKKCAEVIRTRSVTQIRGHAQMHFLKVDIASGVLAKKWCPHCYSLQFAHDNAAKSSCKSPKCLAEINPENRGTGRTIGPSQWRTSDPALTAPPNGLGGAGFGGGMMGGGLVTVYSSVTPIRGVVGRTAAEEIGALGIPTQTVVGGRSATPCSNVSSPSGPTSVTATAPAISSVPIAKRVDGQITPPPGFGGGMMGGGSVTVYSSPAGMLGAGTTTSANTRPVTPIRGVVGRTGGPEIDGVVGRTGGPKIDALGIPTQTAEGGISATPCSIPSPSVPIAKRVDVVHAGNEKISLLVRLILQHWLCSALLQREPSVAETQRLLRVTGLKAEELAVPEELAVTVMKHALLEINVVCSCGGTWQSSPTLRQGGQSQYAVVRFAIPGRMHINGCSGGESRDESKKRKRQNGSGGGYPKVLPHKYLYFNIKHMTGESKTWTFGDATLTLVSVDDAGGTLAGPCKPDSKRGKKILKQLSHFMAGKRAEKRAMREKTTAKPTAKKRKKKAASEGRGGKKGAAGGKAKRGRGGGAKHAGSGESSASVAIVKWLGCSNTNCDKWRIVESDVYSLYSGDTIDGDDFTCEINGVTCATPTDTDPNALPYNDEDGEGDGDAGSNAAGEGKRQKKRR